MGCKLDNKRTDGALTDKRQPRIAVARVEDARSPSAAAAAAAVAESALNGPNATLNGSCRTKMEHPGPTI